MNWTIAATCGFGLEAVVVREFAELGYAARVDRPGRVVTTGDGTALCRCNLWLRSADRVLVELARFPAPDFDSLFDAVQTIPWEEWVTPEAALPVTGRCHQSQLASVPACQRTIKKGLVERLRRALPGVELPETGPPAPIQFSLIDNWATIDLDASGPGLHRRGYRDASLRGQLRETLAAALVQLSFWRPERPLVDPFCSDGAIVIEAAQIARRLAPGRMRAFAAEHWPSIPSAAWRDARQEASDLALPAVPERIAGYDRDEAMVQRARRHAAAAGVEADLHLQQQEFSQLHSRRHYGCVIARPPCTPALGRDEDAEALYRSFPMVLRRLPTWSHFILSDRPDMERLVGQEANKRRKLYHGRIVCTYFQFFGPRPTNDRHATADASEESLVASMSTPPAQIVAHPAETLTTARRQPVQAAFGGLRAEAARQAQEFTNRLQKRARHLRRWPTKKGISCFRIYDRDIPEIPLVVDRYGESLHIAEYERPHERTPAEHADWLDLMVRTAAKALETPRERVFLKHRDRQRGNAQYERVADAHALQIVQEGGLKFEINLSDYIDTGLFLDHRVARGMVRDAAKGARFLNLFAYTGAFTVYAAAGGAVETTTVDLSATYLDWAARNLRLNGFEVGVQHRLARNDAREFLANVAPNAFDLAVVDPPTFSNSKRTRDDWDVQSDHSELLRQVAARMRPGGVIFFSTNRRRFAFDAQALPDCTIREITRQTLPEDFRNERIHRCWRIVRDRIEST